jgi:uncharacterized repeat protein (TIGR03803 family)
MKRIVNSIGTTTCAIFLLWATMAIALPAQTLTTTFTTISSFDGTNGRFPYAGLIQAANGYGYGTTEYGGTSTNCNNGCGTIFRLTPGGVVTSLYSFCVASGCPDGQYPYAPLFQTAAGNFYGTTAEGGTNNYGTVFELSAAGLTTLHSFLKTDGENPLAGVIEGSDGNFYGTTVGGGASNGQGTVFQMTPSGAITTLYTFCEQGVEPACADGDQPQSALVESSGGIFYGTTSAGGANRGGTVFSITSSGTLTTLYSFCALYSCMDGELPYAGLIEATNGNFYGTTFSGGANGGGTVFEITSAGVLTTLYSFCSQTDCADGGFPDAPLVQATDGNFYGTTSAGGTGAAGTVFMITPAGVLSTLYSFASPGGVQVAGLVQATNGAFYGTTWAGGTGSEGTVFTLSAGLTPFVKPVPPSGDVGTAVRILGSSLTGTTSVTFGGRPAVFTVVSQTEITTTVPTGAATGFIKVVSPSGTFLSNVKFRVLAPGPAL